MGISRALACVLALVFPCMALAQLAPNPTGRATMAAFKGADRNSDRALDLVELRAQGRQKGADRLFTLLDSDGDGRLSLKELGHNGPALARFEAYDANKDGFVAKREFPAFVDPVLVTALDENRDGRLGLAEIRPAFAGSRVADVPAQDKKVRKAKVEKPAAYCWIPGFGDGKWIIEGPVLWTRCRTS